MRAIGEHYATVPVGVANLEFETAARLRDEIKRLKMLDLEFANEMLTPAGETADRGAVKRVKAEARAEAAERFRKARPKSEAICRLTFVCTNPFCARDEFRCRRIRLGRGQPGEVRAPRRRAD